MEENSVSPTPAHHNVPVPFAADIPDGVFPGKAILVKGVVLNSHSQHRFNIDLCCGKLVQGDHQDDKALHVNPRFDQGGPIPIFSRPDIAIVLNSLVNNQWGVEQRCQNTLELGKPFSIRILILRDYFKVSINGKHLSDFVHRVPLETIKCIFVAGCVSIDIIEYQGTRPTSSLPSSACPTPNAPCPDGPVEVTKPDVPFIFRINGAGGFLPPREFLLILTPLLNASCFSVNLLCGDEYLFHMRVDFPDKNGPAGERGSIVRNSTSGGGQWQREERQMGRFPFVPGITSDLKVVAVSGYGLKVVIDGSYFCEFNYRPSGPIPTEVSRITVEGDINVQKFILRNRES